MSSISDNDISGSEESVVSDSQESVSGSSEALVSRKGFEKSKSETSVDTPILDKLSKNAFTATSSVKVKETKEEQKNERDASNQSLDNSASNISMIQHTKPKEIMLDLPASTPPPTKVALDNLLIGSLRAKTKIESQEQMPKPLPDKLPRLPSRGAQQQNAIIDEISSQSVQNNNPSKSYQKSASDTAVILQNASTNMHIGLKRNEKQITPISIAAPKAAVTPIHAAQPSVLQPTTSRKKLLATDLLSGTDRQIINPLLERALSDLGSLQKIDRKDF